MFPKRRIQVLFFLLLFTAIPAQAQRYGTETGRVEFTSRVPLHTFTGTSDHLSGEIDLADGSVDFFVDLETLQTGIGRRDRDMRETLETDSFPFAEFTGRLLTTFNPQASGAQQARVQGSFKIHNVSRTITASGTLQKTGNQIRMIANWEINLKDYEITPPRLLVVRVNEVQAVRVNALLSLR